MYRLPHNNTLDKRMTDWKGVTWDATLHINSRQSITSIHVTAYRRSEDGTITEGHQAATVQPFDDLKRVLRELLQEAAVDTLDEEGLQDELPWDDEPHLPLTR